MMEINVSPDIPAFQNYALVLALGGWVAVRQISGRLAGIPGIWWVRRTYLLFLLYTAVPVGLFWLLDRGGAIADTAMFGAILVGVGYQNIIAGKTETIRSPGNLSGFWAPFQAYADSIEAGVRAGSDSRQRQVVNRIVADIASDKTKFQAFGQLALRQGPDIAALAAAPLAADTRYDREYRVRLLYGRMISIPDLTRLMRDEHLISKKFYLFQFLGVGRLIWPAAGLAVLVGLYAVFTPRFGVDSAASAYYAWRIGKTNTTIADQFRAREHLIALLGDEQRGKEAAERLGQLLRNPGLPMERVEMVLRVLMEAAAGGRRTADGVGAMVAALHAVNVDTRRRAQDALNAMATACKIEPAADLKAWKPTDADSAPQLETRVAQWKHAWTAKTCAAA